MATLNDMRTKGGLALSIIIGVTLVLFLVGDFLGSGSNLLNEKKMRVGEVEGTNIGYTEFMRRTEDISNIYRLLWSVDSFSAEQNETIYNAAWQECLMEYAYQPSFSQLGLTVSDAEQVDMINGAYISPVVTGFFADPQTGMFDNNMLAGFMANVSANEQTLAIWNYIKSQMIQERLFSNYSALVTSGYFANALDVEHGVAAAAETSNATVVKVPYSSIADSLFNGKLNSGDVQKYYNDNKRMFKQVPSRDIDYVVFDLLPSEQDYADAEEYINTIAAEFAESDDAMQYATLNSQERPNPTYFKESQLSGALASLAFGSSDAEMVGPELNGDVYTLSRVADIKSLPDSLGARHILLGGGETERADSLIGALKSGADFAALSTEFSLDQAANTAGGDLGHFAPEQMIPEFSAACLDAKVGEYFVVESQFGTHVVELTFKSAPVQKAQIATITYKVDPSDATQQAVYNTANTFLAAAGNDSESFKQAVDDQSLSKRNVRIRNTDRQITGLNDAKELIRWSFNGKVGDVSSILEIDGNYLVAALNAANEDEYAPVDDFSDQIAERLLLDAKVQYVADKIAGSTTLEQVAQKLGVEPIELEGVAFDTFYVSNEEVGVEPRLIGAITSAKSGELSDVIKGYSGAYIFQVSDKTAVAEAPTAEDVKIRVEAEQQAYLAERIQQALQEELEVVDNRVKFF